ncbi:50S ribosomal protein L18P, partial [mine drainage metagenome]
RSRLALLRSGKARFVVRPSKKGFTAQIVQYRPAGDKILCTVTEKTLVKMKVYKDSNNTPASYLIGYITGLKAQKLGIDEAVMDIGRYQITKGGRISAALKGLVDSGMTIPHDKKIFPDNSRISGKHLSEGVDVKTIVKEIQAKIGE